MAVNLPVDDVVIVAVVDAGENLLQQDGSVPLGEFAALQNLVEQFTSLADSKSKIWLAT